MTTTILRFEKHKHLVNIRQAGAHQHRHHISTPNADRCRSHLNRTFIGSSNLVDDVKKRFEILTKEPRKNAVLAMDGILTLSPELFKAGTLLDQQEVLKKFAITSKRWLIQSFGDNVVNAVLHRDETSPHIHFTIVPIQKSASGEYKLNARDMFNKETLHNFQRNYFESMQQYFPSLLPPKYKEKATHRALKEFYTGITKLETEMELFFDSERHQQKIQLREQLEGTITQYIDNWLTQLFVDVPYTEKEEWIELVKRELEKKLDEKILMPKFTQKLTAAKRKALINLNMKI